MKFVNCAFAVAIAFAMASGSAVAGEQLETAKKVSQPTVMSDAELDQIVGGVDVYKTVVGILVEHISDPDTLINVLTNIGNRTPSTDSR